MFLGYSFQISRSYMSWINGSQNFLGHCPLGSINSSPVPPALPYKMHSSEQQFAKPTKEDNKIRYYI
jgi:hypothetical protein